jgi:hypothetical protein
VTLKELLTTAGRVLGGDKIAAGRIVETIITLLDTEAMSGDDRRRLYKLRKKWDSRAQGSDQRWNVHGSSPGRPKKLITKRRTARQRDEDNDPLLARILAKYGPEPMDLPIYPIDEPPEDQ